MRESARVRGRVHQSETAGQTLRAACGVKRFREVLPVSVYARPASERYLVLNHLTASRAGVLRGPHVNGRPAPRSASAGASRPTRTVS